MHRTLRLIDSQGITPPPKASDLRASCERHEAYHIDAYEPRCTISDSSLVGILACIPHLTSVLLNCSNLKLTSPQRFFEAVGSFPQLRCLEITSSLVAANDVEESNFCYPCSTPLTKFLYRPDMLRDVLISPVGAALATTAIHTFHHTLQSLTLPTVHISAEDIARVEWPCLHELHIYGLRWTITTTPLVKSLASMPHLRVLVLNLLEHDNEFVTPVWPRGVSGSFPWPELEELYLSNSSPEDQVYEHLPPTLRVLSVRPFPHQCIGRWRTPSYQMVQDTHMTAVLPSSSALHQIVDACPALRSLKELRIEYRAGDDEQALLARIVEQFPRLCTLEIHRFRDVLRHEGQPKVVSALVSLMSLACSSERSALSSFRYRSLSRGH